MYSRIIMKRRKRKIIFFQWFYLVFPIPKDIYTALTVTPLSIIHYCNSDLVRRILKFIYKNNCCIFLIYINKTHRMSEIFSPSTQRASDFLHKPISFLFFIIRNWFHLEKSLVKYFFFFIKFKCFLEIITAQTG